MTRAVALTKGGFIEIDNHPYMILDKDFYSPGKGAAVVRFKLEDLVTGQTVKKVLRSGEEVKEIYVDNKTLTYLYQNGSNYVFMDQKTFEQYEIPETLIGNKKYFLIENTDYQIAFYQDKPLNIRFPAKVTLAVVKAEAGIKGDRVSGATKEVTLSTGYKLKVPLFIKTGDKVLVNTRNGEYIKKV